MAETVNNHTTWYTMTAEVVGQELQVEPVKGLSAAEAAQQES